MNLKDFNSRYKYQSDKEKFNTSLDIWENPKPDADGFIRCDCESYCEYLLQNIDEFKSWERYYCKILNNQGKMSGHCILYKNGDVIDCNIKQIITLEQHCKIYKTIDLKKYNWFTVFSKKLISKIFLIIKK